MKHREDWAESKDYRAEIATAVRKGSIPILPHPLFFTLKASPCSPGVNVNVVTFFCFVNLYLL